MATPYGPTLLDHARKPRNRGPLASAAISQEASNPLCGDRVRMQLAVADDRITEARFSANACAICVAAASMLTEMVRNLTLDQAEQVSTSRLVAALESEIPRTRIQCVALPVTVMQAGLGRYRAER